MPRMRTRPRPDSPVVDVAFIEGEGVRIDRVSFGPGRNFYGYAVEVDLSGDDLAPSSGAHTGILVWLPAVNYSQILPTSDDAPRAYTPLNASDEDELPPLRERSTGRG